MRFWVPPDVQGLEAQQARYTRQTFAPHAHDTFALCAVDAGAEALRFRGNTVLASAGTLLAVGPGEMHSGGAAEPGVGWTYRILYVSPALLSSAAAEAGFRGANVLPGLSGPLLQDAELTRHFSAVFSAVTTPGIPTLEREAGLLGLLVRMLRRHGGAPHRGRKAPTCTPGVRRARDLIESDFSRNIGLPELARAAGLSPWHLVRAFHQQLGQTPQVYLRALRVRRAQELLATGLPLSEVALACGFADQSHLTRQFTRTIGATPGVYRAAALATR